MSTQQRWKELQLVQGVVPLYNLAHNQVHNCSRNIGCRVVYSHRYGINITGLYTKASLFSSITRSLVPLRSGKILEIPTKNNNNVMRDCVCNNSLTKIMSILIDKLPVFNIKEGNSTRLHKQNKKYKFCGLLGFGLCNANLCQGNIAVGM